MNTHTLRRVLLKLIIIVFAISGLVGSKLDSSTPVRAQTNTPTNIKKAPLELQRDLQGEKIQFSSPSLGDLDNDNIPEIVVGTSNGWIHVIESDGSSNGRLLWSYQTKNALNAVARNSTNTTIRGTPAIADIDNDGWKEVIVPVGDVFKERENGGIVVLTHDGKLKKGWPQLTFDRTARGHTAGIVSSPAVADLDNDGDLEIISGAFDHRVYAWHHDGTWVEGWPQHVFDTVWSSPAVGDIDKDGLLEVAIGVDAHHDPYQDSIDGGALYVFNHDGTTLGGFPRYINEIIASTPALADLNSDGSLDIIVGGGTYYDGSDGYKIHVWDRHGAYLPGWPAGTGDSIPGSPAVADIDNDNDFEVVVGSQDKKIYAWHHTGSLVSGWPTTPKTWNGGTQTQSTTIVADINGQTHPNGKLEILTKIGWEVAIVDSSGNQLTWDGSGGNSNNKPTYYASYTLDAVPSVGDIDNDGKLELVAGGAAAGTNGGQAAVYVWELSDSSADSNTTDWSTIKRDPQRTGLLATTVSNDSLVDSHTIPDQMFPGQTKEVQVTLQNTGTKTWSSNEEYRLGGDNPTFYPSNRVDLPGGTVSPGENVTFSFTIEAPTTPGFYDIEWRMVQDGVGWFGRKILKQIKISDQPAFYVLHADTEAGGVYAGGLAEPIGPPNYTYWERSSALKTTLDGEGYYLLDKTGFTKWAGTAEDVGSVGSSPAVDLELTVDGEGYYVIDRYGRMSKTSGAIKIDPLPPTFGDQRVRSFAVTRDSSGVYVLDKFGHVHTGGTAAPFDSTTPIFGSPIAMKIKLTADGQGYYVLDQYGRIHAGGSAPQIDPNYTPHVGEDWARDFELTEDGQGYYLLDKNGKIYTGGTATPVTYNATPTFNSGAAIDLEVSDSRKSDGPVPSLSTNELSLISEPNTTTPTKLTLENDGGGGELNWEASIEPNVNWLDLSSMSGTTPDTINITVDSPSSPGTYTTSLTFDMTMQDGSVVGSTDVDVTLYVAEQVYRVHLPATIK